MKPRRAAAVASLAVGAGAVAYAVKLASEHFPHGILLLALLWVALFAAWQVIRADRRRAGWLAITVLFSLLALMAILLQGQPLANLVVLALFLLSVALARAAFRRHDSLRAVDPPHRPVLFANRRSGGGKATKLGVLEAAQRRGIKVVELESGDDLRELVATAVDQGADALAMAGGDGSQAVVAELAARNDLPYACIPTGTRNHFALDLGVDRNDAVGALDALVKGRERRVDLGEVNGRVFVNNVSLGLYANAVQRSEYRDAKLRTLLELAQSEMGDEGPGARLRWRDDRGEAGAGTVALLVSNNPYRLGTAIASGTRPALNLGLLGIATFSVEGDRRVSPFGGALRQWSCYEFEITSDDPVPIGIDGEAAVLDAPLRFRSRPSALRVLIAPGHPGASPSAGAPRGIVKSISKLIQVAVTGHSRREVTPEETQTEEYR